MRLQLIAALALVAVVAAPRIAHAQATTDRDPGQGSATAKVSVYQDDDATRVTTSVVDGDVVLPHRVTVGGHVLVDSISAASVDVVAAATPRFSENRYEENARAAARVRGVEVGATYTHSAENDWSSHTVTGTLGRDFAQKNTRVELAYGHVANDVGRAHDPTFSARLAVDNAQLGVTQLLGARTYLGVTYSYQHDAGFQSSPYLYVDVGAAAFPETHPGTRDRHAVTLRLLRALGAASLDASYRLYGDDWGIVSHTAQAAIRVAPGPWDLRVRVRGYYQGHAAFWQETYTMPMRFMSADRELSSFWDASAGAKLARRVGRWVIDAKIDAITYSFLDFARLHGRTAVVGELGLGVVW